jgi:glycosyltransferase involved in cell wall biosynthesis
MGAERVALVHDWLVSMGGAEQVLLELAALYPGAPILTALHDPQALSADFAPLEIHPSFLQHWPGATRRHRLLLPLMPLAFERFDLSGFELVISSSHACAKGIIPPPEACHLAYIHTPIRYAWDMLNDYFAHTQPSALKRLLMHPLLHYLRQWDLLNNLRIDALACNSRFVRARIWRYYRREATVIHPPVRVPDTAPQRQPEDFYLLVSRAVPYKRLDLAIAAFSGSRRRLCVVGSGPELPALRAQAGANIEFLGRVDNSELAALYRQARALIFPGLEDFGIVPVEAQAHGCPVIAYGHGGVCDSVVPDQTGVFFDEQTVNSLNAALTRFEAQHFDPLTLYRQAQQFRPEVFRQRFQDFVAEAQAEFRARLSAPC